MLSRPVAFDLQSLDNKKIRLALVNFIKRENAVGFTEVIQMASVNFANLFSHDH